VEYASLLDQQDRGNFELLQLGWSGRIDPDANITNFVGTGGELAHRAGYEISGGTFNTYLSTLRRNGLADTTGDTVRANDVLFLAPSAPR